MEALYFTPYQKDIQAALQALRERELKLGDMILPCRRLPQMRFPPDESWPAPGAQHASIEEAIEASEESGTGSILDLSRAGSAREFFTVCPLDDQELVQLFGHDQADTQFADSALINPKPGREAAGLFWDGIGRGEGRYIVIYAGSEPCEIFFVGYSFD
jgi:hypothetical protein